MASQPGDAYKTFIDAMGELVLTSNSNLLHTLQVHTESNKTAEALHHSYVSHHDFCCAFHFSKA